MPAHDPHVQRDADRFVTLGEGLLTRHAFSFGDHYDPGNVGHGPLVASNEDLVQTDAGYGDHPHADTEILTWVLSGTLQHVDSRGHRGLTYPGLVQRMSAGTGIVHRERNDGYRVDPSLPLEPVHFVQMWLRPDEPGELPGYDQRAVSFADLRSDWVPVASGRHPDAAVRVLSAGSTLWVTVLAPGRRRRLPEAPLTYLFVARGELEVERVGVLRSGDDLRLSAPAALAVTGRTEAELLVWAMQR